MLDIYLDRLLHGHAAAENLQRDGRGAGLRLFVGIAPVLNGLNIDVDSSIFGLNVDTGRYS